MNTNTRRNVKCNNCQWTGRRRFLNLPCPKCNYWRPIEVVFQEPRWSKELREYIAALGNKVAA